MAMITISGYPCSGKTTRANQLAAVIRSKLSLPSTPPRIARLKVVIINDESLSISKEAYDSSKSEKPARATLLSAVIRALGDGKDSIVIVDAMNYIKGSRYQMYCAAREVKVRICTVFVATPPSECLLWNSQLPSTSSYAPPTIENLLTRFEEPSSTVRWDSPLFTIPHFDPPLDEEGKDGVADRIWEAISEGTVKPPNAATVPIPTSSTSYLTLLESTTTSLITSLLLSQSLSPLSGPRSLLVPLDHSTTKLPITIELNKPVSMALLQRLKRQFVKINVKVGAGKEFGQEEVLRLWRDYLEGNV